MGWRKARKDAPDQVREESLDALGTEEFWAKRQRWVSRYLKSRERGYRRKAIRRGVQELARRNASHFWITLRRILYASLIVACAVVLDALLLGYGLDGPLKELLSAGLARIGVLPLADRLRSPGALGAAAVQIAGVSLPLFYTVLSTGLLRAYQDAPDSVRAYALNRPFIRFFEVPAWTLGLWGVGLVFAAELGLQPGLLTRLLIAGFALWVIAAIPVAFWRGVESGSPRSLVPEMVRDIQLTLEDAKGEFGGPADEEVLVGLRQYAAQQLRTLTETARFVGLG